MEEVSTALAGAIESVLPIWVRRCVDRVMRDWVGSTPPEVAEAARVAGEEAAASVGPEIRRLLSTDIDEQRSTPLAVLRGAVSYPTAVLRAAGAPPVARDSFAERSFPDDLYGLTPASLADIDPSLHEVGLAWGAAKAFEHKRRHS